jgi:hypothetical protein
MISWLLEKGAQAAQVHGSPSIHLQDVTGMVVGIRRKAPENNFGFAF